METHALPLLTIIGEAVLRDRLIEEITRAGAKGYTLSAAEGEGPRHIRSGNMPGENIRIETITTPQIADELLSRLAADYFPHFAIIAFVSQVRIIRGNHYV